MSVTSSAQQETPPADIAASPEEEKPRRRGRPRKVSAESTPKEVEKQVFESVISDLFCRNIRTETQFKAYAKSTKPSLIQYGKDKFPHKRICQRFPLAQQIRHNTLPYCFVDTPF